MRFHKWRSTSSRKMSWWYKLFKMCIKPLCHSRPLSSSPKGKKHHKNSPFDSCTTFQVFWSHTIALCVEHTEICHYSLEKLLNLIYNSSFIMPNIIGSYVFYNQMWRASVNLNRTSLWSEKWSFEEVQDNKLAFLDGVLCKRGCLEESGILDGCLQETDVHRSIPALWLCRTEDGCDENITT